MTEPTHDRRADLSAPAGRPAPSDLPRFAGPLRPFIDFAAGINASAHAKLLAGFMVGAALLLGVSVLDLVVIGRMNQRVDEIAQLEDKVDRARIMKYQVTAQSHYRAMALLTQDDSNNAKIATAKKTFDDNLNAVEAASGPEDAGFFALVRDADARFAFDSAQVLDLYQAGDIAAATQLHLAA